MRASPPHHKEKILAFLRRIFPCYGYRILSPTSLRFRPLLRPRRHFAVPGVRSLTNKGGDQLAKDERTARNRLCDFTAIIFVGVQSSLRYIEIVRTSRSRISQAEREQAYAAIHAFLVAYLTAETDGERPHEVEDAAQETVCRLLEGGFGSTSLEHCATESIEFALDQMGVKDPIEASTDRLLVRPARTQDWDWRSMLSRFNEDWAERRALGDLEIDVLTYRLSDYSWGEVARLLRESRKYPSKSCTQSALRSRMCRHLRRFRRPNIKAKEFIAAFVGEQN